MNKKVCYTCITGGYDGIPVHHHIDDTWDYVLFTDNPDLIAAGKFEHWTVRPLAFSGSTNVKNARWHKINAHILFPEYDISLWMDGNISIAGRNIYDIVDKLVQDDIMVAVPLHPSRTCIYDEARVIKKLHIDIPKTVNREMRYLRQMGYPKNNGLSETNIMFRRHNQIKEVLDLWWQMVRDYSKRDQLSYNYATWKYGVVTHPLYPTPGAHRMNGDFILRYATTHNQDKVKHRCVIYPRWLGTIICVFIPSRKNRDRFKRKHMKPRTTK